MVSKVKIIRRLLTIVFIIVLILFLSCLMLNRNIPCLSVAAGVLTSLIACLVVVYGEPEAKSPLNREPNRILNVLIEDTIKLELNYGQVVVGFALLAGIFVASLVWQGGHAQLYLSAAPFYAAIGFYLFSQGNTIYSLAEARNDFVLFHTADQVTKSAYLIAVAAGGYFLLGVLVSQVDPQLQPLHSRLFSAAAAAAVQWLFFYALRVHRVNHLWFKYVKEQMIVDRT